MKKTFLILLVTFVITNISFAQKLSVGPELGVNLINIEKTALGSNYQLGMHFGIQVKYDLNEHFALSSGVYMTQKKKKYSYIDTTTTTDPFGSLIDMFSGGTGNDTAYIYTTSTGLVSEYYIELPILAHYKIYNIDVFAGPFATVLANVKRTESSTSESTATDPSSFIPGGSGGSGGFGGLGDLFSEMMKPKDKVSTNTSKEGLVTTDFGLIGGIGYHINNLQFNLMYSYSFLDYRSETGGQGLDNHEFVRATIAYLFPIKKKEPQSNARFE